VIRGGCLGSWFCGVRGVVFWRKAESMVGDWSPGGAESLNSCEASGAVWFVVFIVRDDHHGADR
jgi:hypothetical protein